MDSSPPKLDLDLVPLSAFGLADELVLHDGDWHAHQRHQLLYSSQGVLQLEVGAVRYFLPPRRAAWISAGIAHRVTTRAASLRTLYLSPRLVTWSPPECAVFSVDELARGLLLYAMRFGPERAQEGELEGHFFATVAGLSQDWVAKALPFRLPMAQSEGLRNAMRFALEQLHRPIGAQDGARAGGMSLRTLNRRFAEEARTSWREYLHTARMLRAMELLEAPGARVTEVAFEVGFESPAAFTRAFERFFGSPPRDYRKGAEAGREPERHSGGSR